jgi:hypothetical protein|tara:strand:- start:55 stop:1023 length:969 start_codon:yes stop_codon:yes gene_type:complete
MLKNIFKLMILMMFVMFGLQSCGGNDPLSPGDEDNEPELVGCEAANLYDWDSVEFETSLDAGASTWLAFDLTETTLFTVTINQAGFHGLIFNGCDGELGAPPPIFDFQTNGNGVEVGIVTEGTYYLKITNTRPGRLDFTFSIVLDEIVYGCMNDDAGNYNSEANVDDGNCEFQDCDTDYYIEAIDGNASDFYFPMVLDCDGNCSPISWIGDMYCDDGAYGIYGPDGEVVPINLMCEELNWDEGDCEMIDEGCTEGLVEDCNGICAPEDWLGDGFCDDGSYEYNGNSIYFNCDELGNDNGDCDVLGRTTEQRPYPNNKMSIEK